VMCAMPESWQFDLLKSFKGNMPEIAPLWAHREVPSYYSPQGWQ
jgi:hypothetical protein